MKLKCIITDDEPFARKGLQGYVEKIDFLELVATCEDAIQLNTLLQQSTPDLLFLDIEMPYMTGIEFLRQRKESPGVIFTTAYEKYALDGFELNVLDYLLKPISFDRFLKAANKAYDFHSLQNRENSNADFIYVKTSQKIEKIEFEQLLFVEALENYCTLYMQECKVIANVTLKMLLEKLPANRFIQTHKSYIVSMSKINSIEGNLLHVGKFQVPISKHSKEEVLSRILNDRLIKR